MKNKITSWILVSAAALSLTFQSPLTLETINVINPVNTSVDGGITTSGKKDIPDIFSINGKKDIPDIFSINGKKDIPDIFSIN